LTDSQWTGEQQPADGDKVAGNSAIKWAKRGVIITGLLFLVLAIIPIGLAIFFDPVDFTYLQMYRDIWVTVASVFLLAAAFIAVVLLVTIIYIVQAINMQIQTKVLPAIEATSSRLDMLTNKLDSILESTRTIVGNVRESSDTIASTTEYAAEQVVTPIIRVSSLVAGVRAAARTLAHFDDVSHPNENKLDERDEPVTATTANLREE
jgi:uncharacterized protein YoxC